MTPRLNNPTQHDIWCKICGITNPTDAQAVAAAGADALGVNCYPRSSRYVEVEQLAEICSSADCLRVALFVDPQPAEVEAVLQVAEIDVLQFHGDELPEFCESFGLPYLKGFRVRAGIDITALADAHAQAWGLLLDTYVPNQHGGTGETFDWSLWPEGLDDRRLVLAGGLDPHNVATAVERLAPFGVDVAGGVEDETKGQKNAAKIGAFVANARAAAI